MKKAAIIYPAIVMLFLIGVISGCATAKISSDKLEAVKNLKPPADKALVYVVRPQSLGFALHFTVMCNDKKIGAISARRFVYAYLDPGTYRFMTKAENTAMLTVSVQAGQTYFIQQQIMMGVWVAENQLLQLGEIDGRRELAKCQLSPDCPAFTGAK